MALLCYQGSVLMRCSLLFLLLLGASCGDDGGDATTDASPAGYCDETTPCTESGRKYCDLQGAYPASNGQPNTCIPDPALTAECSPSQQCTDAAEPHCTNGGECVECLNFSHCNADNPVCSLTTHTCSTCRVGDEGDQICAAIDPLQPYCSAPGSCAECLENSHCSINSAPICDPGEFRCRACQTGECGAELCNTVTGVCEPAP